MVPPRDWTRLQPDLVRPGTTHDSTAAIGPGPAGNHLSRGPLDAMALARGGANPPRNGYRLLAIAAPRLPTAAPLRAPFPRASRRKPSAAPVGPPRQVVRYCGVSAPSYLEAALSLRVPCQLWGFYLLVRQRGERSSGQAHW